MSRRQRQKIITMLRQVSPLLIGVCAVSLLAVGSIVVISGCFEFTDLSPRVDTRTEDDIDGDGIANEVDDDMDGDGVVNNEDPDADSDGRFDRHIIVDFPFDHNAFLEPLLPPNHPKFDYQGRLMIPAGHIDLSDIIKVNMETHPLEFLQPKRQEEIAAAGTPKTPR